MQYLSSGNLQERGKSNNALVARAYSRTKCMDCKEPPCWDVHWADGRARAWFCDAHFSDFLAREDGTEIVRVFQVNGEVPKKIGDEGELLWIYDPEMHDPVDSLYMAMEEAGVVLRVMLRNDELPPRFIRCGGDAVERGGKGSGHHGHKGLKGVHGGSQPREEGGIIYPSDINPEEFKKSMITVHDRRKDGRMVSTADMLALKKDTFRDEVGVPERIISIWMSPDGDLLYVPGEHRFHVRTALRLMGIEKENIGALQPIKAILAESYGDWEYIHFAKELGWVRMHLYGPKPGANLEFIGQLTRRQKRTLNDIISVMGEDMLFRYDWQDTNSQDFGQNLPVHEFAKLFDITLRSIPPRIERARGKNPMFIGVMFDEIVPILAVQQTFEKFFPDVYFEPQKPERFHITLFHSENVNRLQAGVLIAALGQPGQIPVEFSELGTFTSGEAAPVVIHVKMNEFLSNVQRRLYQTGKALGLDVSPYSVSNQYRPHITIAHEFEDGSRIPKIELSGKVMGTKIVFSRADYKPVHETILQEKPSAGVMNTAQYLRRLVLGRTNDN